MGSGQLSQGGRVLSLHFRMAPLGKDSLAAGESAGRTASSTAQLRTRGTATSSVWASFVVRANGLP